jgi:type II protein arginine methyltransferase
MIEKEIPLQGSHLNSLSQATLVADIAKVGGGPVEERLSSLAERLVSMGEAHLENMQFASAVECFESALYIAPQSREARLGHNRALCSIVPRWHFEMLNDEQRNAAFEEALARAVTPDSVVLDIGSGTGLLAMMAARAGAREVVSCEMVAPLAELARETIALNGFSDRIQIMNKKSTSLAVGTDIRRRSNLLVTETVDCGLLGEGIIPSITHARAQLLTDDACIIPRAASVHAMLVEGRRLRGLNYVSRCAGFDVSPMQRYATARYIPVRLAAFQHVALTDPFEVFRFDFARGSLLPERRELSIPIIRDGVCQAIIFWFDMQLDDEISISNRPGSTTHWEQALQCVEHELTIRAGEMLRVEVEHDCHSVFFHQPAVAPTNRNLHAD